ncbi:MAG: 6-pyruvoyl-tetrahydropterin synthase-related protein, partial [Anaerolineae bacterium]
MQALQAQRRRLAAWRPDPYLWLVILFALFAALPLAGPDYFFDAHDAPNTVFFLTEFDAALRDGVWYPGWATDQALGYGYPTFVFYPPLAYYVAEGFHLLGAGQVAAVKWTFALATVAAGLAMYLYGRQVMGRRRGFLASVVYVYIPYHLVDIYVRAALAEYFAFVWMPLALLAFHHLVEAPSARRLGLAALAYGGLWLAHNPTGLSFTPLLAAYVLFRLLAGPQGWRGRLQRAAAPLVAALLGMGIAAALLLPNLLERDLINQEQWVRAGYDYSLHFLQPAHLLSPAWGYLPGTPGTEGVMSHQLGAVPVLLAAVAVVALPRRSRRERALALFFGGATLALLFFMMPLSAGLWELLPIAGLIQFPWRLLALTAVTLAVLSGFCLDEETEDELSATEEDGAPPATRLHGPTLILALVALGASLPYLQPQFTPTPASAGSPLLSIEFELEYEDMRGMTAWTEEMPPDSPLVAQYLAGEPLVTAEALAPGATVEMIRAGGASDELWVRSP